MALIHEHGAAPSESVSFGPTPNIDVVTQLGMMHLNHGLKSLSVFDVGYDIDVTSADVDVVSTLDPDSVLSISKVSDTANFDASSKWYIVLVNYTHETSDQHIVLTHFYDGSDWKAYATFTTDSNDGIWQKDRVILIDKMGDVLKLGREHFGTIEDLDVTSNN